MRIGGRLCVLRYAYRMYTCTYVTQENGLPLEQAEPQGWCLPNAVGLKHTLPDAVDMHIHLRRVGGDKHQVRMWSPCNAVCHLHTHIPCAYNLVPV